jgi:serine/threonine-protein kinase RsbW
MDEAFVIELNLPAMARFLNVLGAGIVEIFSQIDDLPDRDQVAYNFQLSAHEVCANIVEHAYAGSAGRIAITLTLRTAPRQLVVELRDDSTCAFDPTQVHDPAPDELQTRGRGLWLARQLVDELVYESRMGKRWRATMGGAWQADSAETHTPGQNYWRLTKNL